MSTAKFQASRPKTARPIKAGQTYRGVRLQEPVGKSRFSPQQITEAVKVAIAKNHRVFAGER